MNSRQDMLAFSPENARRRSLGRDIFNGPVKPYQELRPFKAFLIQQSQRLTSSATVNDGVKVNNVLTIRATNRQLVLSKTFRTIWLTSRTGDNWFPRGSAIDMLEYPYYEQDGVAYFLDDEPNPDELGPANEWEDQSLVSILNNSGSPQLFIFDTFTRYIINGVGESG